MSSSEFFQQFRELQKEFSETKTRLRECKEKQEIVKEEISSTTENSLALEEEIRILLRFLLVII